MYVQPFSTNSHEMEININGVRIHARIFDDDRLEIVRIRCDNNADPNEAWRSHGFKPVELIEASRSWKRRAESQRESDRYEAEDH